MRNQEHQTTPDGAASGLSDLLGAWKPMKTAPKDGTAVMALLDGSDIPYAMRWLPSDDPRGSGKDGWHITWDGERLSDHFPVRYWMLCPPDPDSVNAVAPNAQVSGAARPEATD